MGDSDVGSVALPVTLPATTPTPVAQAPSHTASIGHPVGSPDWGQALGQQILLAVQGGQQTALLQLDPAHLGPLQVRLQVHDGQVQAQFVSAHAAVRQAVESALPQLHELFAGSGLSLTHTSVGAQGGGQAGGRGWGGARPGLSAAAAVAASAADHTAPAALAPRWQRGLVNTYV